MDKITKMRRLLYSICILFIVNTAALAQWDGWKNLKNPTFTTVTVTGAAIFQGAVTFSGTVTMSQAMTSTSSITLTRATGDTVRLMGAGGAFLEIEDNNVSQLMVTSAGDVGIGESTPAAKLEVQVADAINIQLESDQTDNDVEVKYVTNGEDWTMGAGGSASSAANDFFLYNNSDAQYRLIIDQDGNLGIATTTPLRLLDVAGSTRIKGTGTVTLTGTIDPTASATVDGVGTLFLTELVIGDQLVVTGENRTVTAIASDIQCTVDAAFSDNANDTTPDKIESHLVITDSGGTTDLVVDADGKVGIGTASPASILHIQGTTPTVTLDDGTYLHEIITSQAEGLAGADLRIGLDESNRTLIIADQGDIGTDFAFTANSNPSIKIVNAAGSESANISAVSLLSTAAYQIDGNRVTLRQNVDVSAGNAMILQTNGGNTELTDTDAEQAFLYIEPRVDQTGTANYVGLLLDVVEEDAVASGQDYLMDLRLLGDSKFNVQTDGQVTMIHTTGADSTIFNVDANGDLTITPSGGDVTIEGNLIVTGTESKVGEFYWNANGTATTMETANSPIGVRYGTTGDMLGFTFDAGGTGAITGYADFGVAAGDTVTVSDASHGLATGDFVVIRGTTNYNGVWQITDIDGDSFYILDTWVADDGASDWEEPSYLQLTAGTNEEFNLIYMPSTQKAGGASATVLMTGYVNTTTQPKTRSQREFPGTDIGVWGGGALVQMSAGDRFFLVVESDNTNDLTFKYGNVRLLQE